METKTEIKEIERKVLIGITEDMQVVFAELDTKRGYFSVTHTTLEGVMTEGEGEQRAQEYLDDGEMWKMAVESGNTELSMDDWNEQVISIDGWEHTVGDIEYIGDDYYIQWSSCGASIEDFKKKYQKLYISQDELDAIIESDKLHLKYFNKFKKADWVIFSKVEHFFKKEDDDIEMVLPDIDLIRI